MTDSSKQNSEDKVHSKSMINGEARQGALKEHDKSLLGKRGSPGGEGGLGQKEESTDDYILKNPVANPVMLSISEAAKLGGVNTKTIRRAIQSGKIKYTIYKNRYQIEFKPLIVFLNTNTKLKNKLNFNGIGQYIKEWRD